MVHGRLARCEMFIYRTSSRLTCMFFHSETNFSMSVVVLIGFVCGNIYKQHGTNPLECYGIVGEPVHSNATHKPTDIQMHIWIEMFYVGDRRTQANTHRYTTHLHQHQHHHRRLVVCITHHKGPLPCISIRPGVEFMVCFGYSFGTHVVHASTQPEPNLRSIN